MRIVACKSECVCDIALAYAIIHVFGTPFSPFDLFFLGKSVWTLNQMVESGILQPEP